MTPTIAEAPSPRILHLFDHSVPQYSGYSFRSRYIVLMQRRAGLDVEVVTSARHEGSAQQDETIDDIVYHRTSRPTGAWDRWQLRIPFWRERLMTRAMATRLHDVAVRFKPHVLHAHSPFFNGRAALRVGRELGIPVVYEIRAFWEDDAVDKKKFAEGSFVYRQVRRLETDVVRRADHVVCICEGLRDDLVRRGIAPSKITLIKNGAEPDVFTPVPKDPAILRKYGLEGKRVIGFIGSFFHYEGLPDLVEAVARCGDELSEAAFLLVGGGEDEAAVRAAVDRHGLGNRIVLAGRVPHGEIAGHYAVCDALIYPRRSKRITELVTPLKPLEAMAMEKVVIGSDVGGIRELFHECEVGSLFAPDDPSALDRALREFMQRTPQALEKEGRAGREAVLSKRRWEKTIEPIIPVYESLMGRIPVGGGVR